MNRYQLRAPCGWNRGRRKFSYGLRGDTVNAASRMESFWSPGRIQITEATRDLLGNEYACEPGGIVDIEGKGPMSVWFLGDRVPGQSPNEGR